MPGSRPRLAIFLSFTHLPPFLPFFHLFLIAVIRSVLAFGVCNDRVVSRGWCPACMFGSVGAAFFFLHLMTFNHTVIGLTHPIL